MNRQHTVANMTPTDLKMRAIAESVAYPDGDEGEYYIISTISSPRFGVAGWAWSTKYQCFGIIQMAWRN